MKKLIFAAAALLLFSVAGFAQKPTGKYVSAVFGSKSDGITDNTGSFQKAIDFISENGGGMLEIYVGRYLTGSLQIKDNVTIYLGEGAVLVGSTNIYDYKGAPALIWAADGAKNVGLAGKGVVEGRQNALKADIAQQQAKGYLPEDFKSPAVVAISGSIGAEVKIVNDTANKPLFL